MSQWVKVPPGASGSSISTASSWVPDGGVLHCRRGRRFAPSQVNSRGNVPPARSGLVTVSGEGFPWLGPFTAGPPHPVSSSRDKTAHAHRAGLLKDDGRPVESRAAAGLRPILGVQLPGLLRCRGAGERVGSPMSLPGCRSLPAGRLPDVLAWHAAALIAKTSPTRAGRQLRPHVAAGPSCRLPCRPRTPHCASRTSRPPARRPRPAAGSW